MSNTTRSDIPREVNNFYDKTLLMRAEPLLLHTKFAQVRDIPQGAGTNVIKFRRYVLLEAATTPLSEGITPVGSKLSTTEITASVEQYGDYITLTDVVQWESKDMVLTETAELLGQQSGNTLDILTREVLVAGTSVYYGGTATSRVQVAAGDIITTTLIRKAVRTLYGNNAMEITSMIDASTGYNTSPINSCFVGLCNEKVAYDLEAMTGWIPVEKYARTQSLMPGEIGAYNRVRFLRTTNGKTFSGEGAAGIDVHATLIIAQNAYGVSRVSGLALQNIVKPLGSGGTSDPLNQRGTSGWKATFVAIILNDDFMVRLETAATA